MRDTTSLSHTWHCLSPIHMSHTTTWSWGMGWLRLVGSLKW